jgi:hypothetical protein
MGLLSDRPYNHLMFLKGKTRQPPAGLVALKQLSMYPMYALPAFQASSNRMSSLKHEDDIDSSKWANTVRLSEQCQASNQP